MEGSRTIILLSQLTSTTSMTPPQNALYAEPAPDSALGSMLVTLQPAITAFNNTTDIDALLVDKLGPRRKDIVSVVLLTIVYSLILLTGVVGNVCTCLVIARTSSMQTTTNYYLFSLAVSDLLLILIGLPPELYSIWEAYPWRLGEVFCYLRQTVMELTSYATVLTITAFTVERYLAICHPLLAHKISALSRAVKIIISIWVVSLLMAIPYAAHTRLFNGVYIPGTDTPIPDSLVCSIPFHFLEGFMYYMFQVSTFLFFIGPVTVIIILYILIGLALRRSPLSRGSTLTRGSTEDTSYSSMKSSGGGGLPHQPRKVVIRMLVAVTVAFIVCWAPFHAQRLMVLYVPKWTPELLLVQSHIFYVSGVLYFVSSTVNPILYNVISKRYRAAFKQIIFPCCFSHPGVQTLSMARHSERYSKSQALVVLKNGGDEVRMVFRQDSGEPVTTYDTIPLNHTRRRTLSAEGVALMGVDGNYRAVNGHGKNAQYDLPKQEDSNHRPLLNGRDGTVSRNTAAGQKPVSHGFARCPGNSKIAAGRVRQGDALKGGEESQKLIKRTHSNNEQGERKSKECGGDLNHRGRDVGPNKMPLRSCLRQSRSLNAQNCVIENPGVRADAAMNSPSVTGQTHNVPPGQTHNVTAPGASFALPTPAAAVVSPESQLLSHTSAQPSLKSPLADVADCKTKLKQGAMISTNSGKLSNGRKIANGHVSFHELLTNNHSKDV